MSAMTINDKQRRSIFGLARELDVVGDNLRALVHSVTGVESIKELTGQQADKVVQELSRRLRRQNQKAPRPGRATDRMLWKQRDLAKQLGWTEEQLLAFVNRIAKVDKLEWQYVEDASNVIEGLKKMLARKEDGPGGATQQRSSRRVQTKASPTPGP